MEGGGEEEEEGALPLKDPFALIIQLSQRQILLQSWIVGLDAGIIGWSYMADVIQGEIYGLP